MRPDAVPVRETPLWAADVIETRRDDGSQLYRSPLPLPPVPDRLTDRLVHWARVAPDRLFLTEPTGGGGRRGLTYAETLDRVRRIGSALLGRGLSAERPIVILSGNDIDHALLTFAALHIGVPVAPISTAYSLVATEFGRIAHVVRLLTPGLVFVAEGMRYARVLRAAIPEEVELVVARETKRFLETKKN